MSMNSFFYKEVLAESWGWVALRGVISLLFAFIVFIWPFASVVAMAWVWGIFAVVDGAFALVAGCRMRSSSERSTWPYLIWGALGVVAGLVAISYPGATALILLMVIAWWAIIGGIFQLFAAVKWRHAVDSFWLAIVFGVISIVFGCLLLARPIGGLLAIAWIVGFYAAISGSFFISIALRLRKMHKLNA